MVSRQTGTQGVEATATHGALPASRGQVLLRSIRERPVLYLMAVPGVLWFLIFCYWPMYGIVIAFQDFDMGAGFWRSPWVGLKHFTRFVTGQYFWRLIRNTLLLRIWSLVFGFPAPILFAILLNEIYNLPYKRVVQTISYLPHFLSTPVVVAILVNLVALYGAVNNLLGSLGLPRHLFLQDPRWFRTLYVASGVWQGVGWGSIIYIAAMAGINPELYESAIADGASRLQRVVHITLPGLVPTLAVLLILNIASLMSVGFEKVYLMYNPSVYETADVISTYVYREGLLTMNYSYGAAVGMIGNVVNFVLLFFGNALVRRVSEYSLF